MRNASLSEEWSTGPNLSDFHFPFPPCWVYLVYWLNYLICTLFMYLPITFHTSELPLVFEFDQTDSSNFHCGLSIAHHARRGKVNRPVACWHHLSRFRNGRRIRLRNLPTLHGWSLISFFLIHLYVDTSSRISWICKCTIYSLKYNYNYNCRN